MHRLAAKPQMRRNVIGHIAGVGDDGRCPVHFPLHIGQLADHGRGPILVPGVVEEVQIVDRQHDGHAGIERQILARLVCDMPEVVAMPPLKGSEEWPIEAGEGLLPPGADLDLLDAFGPEVPDGFLGKRLRQEKHRIECPLAEGQDALGQVPAEPAQPTVGMTQLFEVKHHAGPVGPRLLDRLLCEKPVGDHEWEGHKTTERKPADTSWHAHRQPRGCIGRQTPQTERHRQRRQLVAKMERLRRPGTMD
jgi:hypothetical protein